jgi:nitrogen-specific signal transduction histidine kinase
VVRPFPDFLMNAPVLINVQRGTEPRLDLFNLRARTAVGDRDHTGKTLAEAFPELEQWLRKITAIVLGGQPYVGVEEPLALDWSGTGKIETRYLTFVCEPLLDATGVVEGSVLFAVDVTDCLLARRLNVKRCDRTRLEAALDCLSTPVVLAEPGTRRILFANAATRALHRGDMPSGTTFGQALGMDTGYFCTDATGARIPEDEMPDSRASRGEMVDALELLWHTPFGNVPLVCFAEMVPATPACPSVVVLSFFDVSHVKRVEQELVDAVEARDTFLSLASLAGHELRTPLTTLKLQIQSLLGHYPDAAGIAAIERATRRMGALVEQLLDSARIRDVGVNLEPEDLDLCVVVDAVVESFRSEARRRGSPVARVGAPEVRGRWDRLRLEHVLTNLVCNALRFGPGAPISVECRDLDDRVSVAVTDGGIGIDAADHERIFQRFTRAVSPRHFGGLGLGLWITREIVTRMGGSIAVRSAVGQGATFTVELPKTPPTGTSTNAFVPLSGP